MPSHTLYPYSRSVSIGLKFPVKMLLLYYINPVCILFYEVYLFVLMNISFLHISLFFLKTQGK